MATFYKKQIGVFNINDPELSYCTMRAVEGASQTWVAGAPVVLSSGLVVEAANPATDVWGFALEAGQNVSTSPKCKILPVIDGVALYANFLASGGANNNIAAADVGSTWRLAKGAYGEDGSTIWYAEDTASSQALKMVSLETDQVLPNVVDNSYAAVGDTNARVKFIVLDSVRSFD